MLDPKQITDDLRGQFRGRLHFDRLTRGLYSTDASPFQVEPLAVAVPEDADDVAALVRYCHGHNIPVIPRGAGTGLAGESLGPAVVLDLSVHFRRILAVGPDTVTVQPGVVLSDLNAELAKAGRRFAPDPASGATCTVGGMIATNASGGNAFHHGYTRDYVARLGVVWDAGDADVVGEGSGVRGPASERTETIRAAVKELLTKNAERVAITRTRTPFDRCGYQLHGVLTPGGVDLAKLLVGSEGTLAIVTEATLRTVPLAGGTCLTLVGFPTLDAAVRAGLALRRTARSRATCSTADSSRSPATRGCRPSARRWSSPSRPTPSAKRRSGRGARSKPFAARTSSASWPSRRATRTARRRSARSATRPCPGCTTRGPSGRSRSWKTWACRPTRSRTS